MHADDIGFHFNPRLEEGVVVLNSRVAGEWQSDKRHPLTGSEFKLGEQFKIMLYCQDNKIRVFVNDKYLTKLKHRVELYKISHINMEGDMSVQSLEFGMMGKYPDTGIHILDAVPNQPQPIPFPNIKFHTICVIGKSVDSGSEGFALNFLGEDEQDIALHINPRHSEQQIVRNTLLKGSWQDEERQLDIEYPFATNCPFMMEINADRKGIHVYLNGVFLFTYVLRPGLGFKKIRSLVCHGDVIISKLSFY
uniref:Galectin n=1 Tax=Ciona savignyi TaxID=51511 RepID=H2YEG0_CIOSA